MTFKFDSWFYCIKSGKLNKPSEHGKLSKLGHWIPHEQAVFKNGIPYCPDHPEQRVRVRPRHPQPDTPRKNRMSWHKKM